MNYFKQPKLFMCSSDPGFPKITRSPCEGKGADAADFPITRAVYLKFSVSINLSKNVVKNIFLPLWHHPMPVFLSLPQGPVALFPEADAKVRTFSLFAIKKKNLFSCLSFLPLPSEAGCKGTKCFPFRNTQREVFSSLSLLLL
ncbi:hypothetical protein [Pontibacter pamirensis]|uniref:hypothetical protein n=1 Tax=Pontibacter pamirensis TaxID=2562824 RepID=UPI0013895482|nr:hypothetical protein [Pontibacter pamirensis]